MAAGNDRESVSPTVSVCSAIEADAGNEGAASPGAIVAPVPDVDQSLEPSAFRACIRTSYEVVAWSPAMVVVRTVPECAWLVQAPDDEESRYWTA